MNRFRLPYNPIKRSIYAFEHTEDNNGTVIIGVEVAKKNGELDIAKKFMINDLKDLPERNISSAHLVITDNQILTKEIVTKGTDQEIVSEAYPNLEVDNFYYQILKTSEKSFISICRKTYVDDIISTYKDAKIAITSIDLGNLTTTALIPFIKDSKVLTFTASITIQNEELLSITRNDKQIEHYEIDSLVIPSSHLLPFASILHKVSGISNISGNVIEKNTTLEITHKELRFFKKTLYYGIGFLLIALLINFFVFNSNYKKLQELKEEEQVYNTQKETIKKQQLIVNTKENIVQSILSTGFSKSSYYADQIIQSLPLSVLLKSYNYQPVLKTLRNDKPITIKQKAIVITGDSLDKTSFTNWIHKIEDLNFVDKVTILSYGIQKKKTAIFEIEIKLIDDTKK
ncbi:hypothetical protein [uncultured Aquimarina sp.]|uniref:hypothetical protein n=1 Tax=uncultured Aquimarina sp. TaxID=575652 RepID=UPI00263803C4|nr:hypothetical protein [uncultured Aquimarina sp.]